MPKRSLVRNVSKAVAALTAVLIVGACGGSPQARSITVTFIRHAQSESNASGIIDTSVPGPGLTPEGQGQAQQIAHQAGRKDYDGIYASTMVRTQQTAAPLASELGKQVEVLQGIQEINAGWFEGKPIAQENATYLLAPADWLRGDMQDSIPGSVSGKQFNEGFTAAMQKVYNSGQHNPVVFSHKFAIEYWTLMNTKNAKDTLLTSHPLPNTGRVVITGNPMTGWTLVEWDGIRDFHS
ncbi:histidine phosphatase family protein [Mycobacterium sp. 852002-53434_SCH5985345]|uniref:histidine phosphatase family protein n=1 Tax=unclassified Mycobacterium TaxID=2642494 RepID=UPI000801385A|nr:MULTISPECIES: histidine phosphatase family protein [unclassified Mycobacterium]OBF61459.1 histidine phosphatase family protein [Mycobacterium sp. 852002-53434_SCH5985345]OBF73464.1 histidine phosphatase family protein [Mycobacterium sp. 852002-51613_SCH5001154]OBG00461.1 histidine phosphatase family protein [Mycobacterium sp. 852014-52450_SCH5900713]